MTMDKGYILDVTRFLGLSLDYVTMLFIGLVFCKKGVLYYWFNTRKILQCKIFF